MDISVIICTYNRAEKVLQCLSHLEKQCNTNKISWEVIVVDNNSTDETNEVVAKKSAQSHLTIHYAFERRQGLNHARNRGIQESKGKFLAFIDDDIIVSPDWLKVICTALIQHDADAVGGRIHLDKLLDIPSWIRPDMYGFLGYQDLGEEPMQLDGFRNYPFGGNMAFNRRVVRKIGLFNPGVGRKGSGQKRSELFKGSETEYFHRMAAAGCRIFYQPDAIVYHRILPFQMKKRYFRTIHYNAGLQKALYSGKEYGRNFFGVPLFLYNQAGRELWKYLMQVAKDGPNYAFRRQMTMGYLLGMVRGYAQRSRES